MSTFVQVFRFAIVGVAVTALHVLVATWLITAEGVWPVTANGIAFVTATLVSYIANTLWSFKHRLHPHSLLRFMSVSMVGLLSTLGISAMAQAIGLAYYYGIAAVVLVAPWVSFLLHRTWTYH